MVLKKIIALKPLTKALLVGSSSGVAFTAYSVDSPEDLRQLGLIRFGRAAATVGKIVVDYKTSLRGLKEPSAEYGDAIKECHQRSANHLLKLACVNGGVFIKVGQHISGMEYLIPPEYTNTLGVLTSQAPQASKEDVIYVVESELKSKVGDLFSEFSEKPVGAASLAQVHKAKLKETGETVAVKVQHKRVYKNSKSDVTTMEFLVKCADAIFPEFRLMWLVDEIKKNLPNELDFFHEAKNADEAARRFKHLKFLRIPKIRYDLTTKRVLTMEFCEGAHVDDVEYLRKHKIDPHDVCVKIGKTISEMIFLQGYLHSDPHPGNVLINSKGSGKYEIVLLDHGLYLNISDHIRKLYSDLWLAIIKPDLKEIRLAESIQPNGRR
uniref:Protein kinase domain-containing protein n=1 Tax=Caenorhabditis japonica TaxID=281687 RepID=A0A8R1HMP0_CAEJA